MALLCVIPKNAPPYEYRITYPIWQDTELMHAAEVVRHIAQPAKLSGLPEASLQFLTAVGGRLPEPPSAPAAANTEERTNQPSANQQGQPNGLQTQQGQRLEPESESSQQSGQRTTSADRVNRAQARRQRRRAAGLIRVANHGWMRTGLRMGHANAHGLSALTSVEITTAVKQLNMDILGVTETWEGKCQPADIPGYTYIGKPRQGQQGGGVGFYISRTLCPMINVHKDTELPESIWLELSSKRRNAQTQFVGLVYLPPSCLTNTASIEATYAALKSDIERF